MRSSAVGKAKKNKPKGLANFHDKVKLIVHRIPRGKLLSYGQVAALAGSPRAARIVGGILFGLGPGSGLPWQRVVNGKGGLSTYRIGFGERQRALLEREGIDFDARGHADLKAHQWWPAKKFLNEFEVEDDLAASLTLRLGW